MKKVLLYLFVTVAAFSIGAAAKLFATYTPPSVAALSSPAIVAQPIIEKPQAAAKSCEQTTAEPEIKHPKSEVVSNYDFNKFDPTGTYYPLRRLPSSLGDFESLSISTHYNDEMPGGVYVDVAATEYSNVAYTSFGTITNRQIKLVAVPDSEAFDEFRFEGKFLRRGNVWDAAENTPVLKGKLQRFSNNEKIAEATVEFVIEADGC